MILRDKECRRKAIEVVSSRYYNGQVDKLEGVLRFSRMFSLGYNAESLFNFQEGLVNWVSKCENTIREGKQQIPIARSHGDDGEVTALDLGLAMNRSIVRIIQSIADGLAWRVLHFDRPFLRLMVTPERHRGSVDFATAYPGMRKVAQRLMNENGSRILVNDLTHVLRVGDLTELMLDGRTIIHELKKGGDRVINAYTVAQQEPKSKISQQVENVVTAQVARDFRRIHTDQGVVVIENVGVPFKNDLDAVSKLLQNARKYGYAKTLIGRHLFVECHAMRTITDAPIEQVLRAQADGRKEGHGWPDGEEVMSISSWDLIFNEHGEYMRNATPYAIFPFSTRDTLDLISGRLLLHSWLNISEVKRFFAANGWEVLDVDEIQQMEYVDKARNLTGSSISTALSTDPIPAFTLKRGRFNLPIPLPWVLRILSDFMNPAVLLALAEQTYAAATPDVDAMLDTFITGETKVWM